MSRENSTLSSGVVKVEMEDTDAKIAYEHSITETNTLEMSQRIRQRPESKNSSESSISCDS